MFEELKLVDEFVPAQHAAVLRTLAVERAIMGDDPDEAKDENAIQWFLDSKRIERPNLSSWLASNDLGADGLRRLATEQHIVDHAYDRIRSHAATRILDHLRAHGIYPAVAERARDKRTFLRSLNLEHPSLEELNVCEERLWTWFFEHHKETDVPDDIEAYALSAGFGSVEELGRAALREACYSGGLRPPLPGTEDAGPAGLSADDASRTRATYRDAAAFLWSRTDTQSRIEGLVTSALFDLWLPAAPARVVDAGGGNGRQAFALAARGYEVHLSDVVPELINDARSRQLTSATPLTDIAVAEARALPHPDHFADVVLSLGPLYHLTSAEARIEVLREARRVLRPGGVVIAQMLSRAGALRSVLTWHAADAGLVDWTRLLEEGRFGERDAIPGFFRACYFHDPDEIEAEFKAAGLALCELRGLDPPAPDAQASLAETPEEIVEHWSRLALEIGERPEYINTASHLLAVARAPTGD